MTEPDKQPPPTQSSAGAIFKCPHCAYQQVVHMRGSEIVTIYRCPNCGQLVAPVKNPDSLNNKAEC